MNQQSKKRLDLLFVPVPELAAHVGVFEEVLTTAGNLSGGSDCFISYCVGK